MKHKSITVSTTTPTTDNSITGRITLKSLWLSCGSGTPERWYIIPYVCSKCKNTLIDQPVVLLTTMLCEVNFIGVVTELLNGTCDALVDEVMISDISVL